jgi:hypothetical protein
MVNEVSKTSKNAFGKLGLHILQWIQGRGSERRVEKITE